MAYRRTRSARRGRSYSTRRTRAYRPASRRKSVRRASSSAGRTVRLEIVSVNQPSGVQAFAPGLPGTVGLAKRPVGLKRAAF